MMRIPVLLVASLFAGLFGWTENSTLTLSAEEVATGVTPVSVQGNSVKLTPKNTSIQFVGTHEGDKPDPRKGGFGEFTGTAEVDSDGTLQSVAFEIDTTSLWTEFPKLTAHLKSPDFFDVRTYPKASFKSTSVASGSDGKAVVTGEFTLLKVKKEIKIPVTTSISPEGLTLTSDFKLDRTQFGMSYGQGKVSDDVALSVIIGKPTEVPGS
ncbi:YceI family protein [Roseiconus nitratireducens]|uniref:YceI family protein n=1 Tax=Roseiconus nitratireducens TaxID=2605748 RepID=A0A5M6CVL5_9BACT|nr:YceI family protein [Roseiconus nitratireducens]KAA5538976.1 YceI family protein [Roseiconus nitratireducens]